jgi:hypothetical protein
VKVAAETVNLVSCDWMLCYFQKKKKNPTFIRVFTFSTFKMALKPVKLYVDMMSQPSRAIVWFCKPGNGKQHRYARSHCSIPSDLVFVY